MKIFSKNHKYFLQYLLKQARPILCNSSPNYRFCVEINKTTPEIKGLETDQVINYYRQTIKTVRINDKGRGQFSEQNLLKMIDLSKDISHQAILYQAYYNFIGHYTVFSNSTVDKMLTKILNFEGCSLQNAVQLFANHNYLSYFPHYRVTELLLRKAYSNQDTYAGLLFALFNAPLIKFDSNIVHLILQNLSRTDILPKLLVSRQINKQLDQIITRSQLFDRIFKALEDKINNRSFKIVRRSAYVSHWLNQISEQESSSEELHFKLSVLALTVGVQSILGKHITQIKNTDNLIKVLLYLQLCPEEYRLQTVKYLKSLELSQDLQARLGEFKEMKIDPTKVSPD